MKDGEWRTVCGYLEVTWTVFSYVLCAQGTALFMSGDLLEALKSMKPPRNRVITSGFTYQHRLCHDFESLIWVVVYAMMIHQRNIFAATDPEMSEDYKTSLDFCWAAHSYSNLLRSHDHMMSAGCKVNSQASVNSWFPDPAEAAFFREAMRLIRDQGDGVPITYGSLCALFKKHITLAQESRALDMISG